MTLQDLILEAQKLTLGQQLQLIATLLKHLPQTLLQRRNPAPTTPPPSILDRMGGTPHQLLENGHLSDRDDRRAAIQTYLQEKQCRKPF